MHLNGKCILIDQILGFFYVVPHSISELKQKEVI